MKTLYLAAGSPLSGIPPVHLASKIWFILAIIAVIFLSLKQSGASWWHMLEGIIIGALLLAFFPPLFTFLSGHIAANVGRSGTSLVTAIAILAIVVFAIVMVVRERRSG
jgi:small neutral amino acid transporter SnatA (MarC family)